MKRLIVIAGPTAVGKTELAVALAEALNTEIVSADSRQVYKEMVIGTAQPFAEQLRRVPHHFIGSQSIFLPLNAASYAEAAHKKINALFSRYNHVILVGGSGLYMDALLHGMDSFPSIPDAIKAQVAALYSQNGLTYLSELLAVHDPVLTKSIDLKNPRRVMRALAVCLAAGKPYSSYLQKHPAVSPEERGYEAIKFFVSIERNDLYERINRRTEQMIQTGWIDEAKTLFPYRRERPLQTVGYQELFGFLEGHLSENRAVDLIKQHTRNFAKRQITWFKKDDTYHWVGNACSKTDIASILGMVGP